MKRYPVTVLIPAFNSISLLPQLLDDLKWAEQILVVDSYSTDGTVEYCKAHGADVIQHQYINSAKQKNWAIPQCRYEWVLLVDTDERLPLELQQEIQDILASDIAPEVNAYRIARKTIVLGKWLKSMRLWPDYQVRLFRRDVGRYEDKEVHADIQVPGAIRTLNNPLIHNSVMSLSKQIKYLDRYSRYQADELEKRGRVFRWHNLLLRPIAAFLYLYLVKGGMTEGFRGLFVAFHTMAFTFFTHAKLWEKEWQAEKRR